MSRGRRRALLIGCGTFDHPALSQLLTPAPNVEDLCVLLRDSGVGRFAQADARVLIDQASYEVRLAVEEFFRGAARDDLLLLYYAGHGITDDEFGELSLACRNTDPALPDATALPASTLTRYLDQTQARRVVVILDCCYSGAFTYGAPEPAAATLLRGRGGGRVILTAGGSSEHAWESEARSGRRRNSDFTHVLLIGIRTGEADLDGDGEVSVDELFTYARDRMVADGASSAPRRFWGLDERAVISWSPGDAGLRDQYLDWLIEQHSRLYLHGIREARHLPSVELEKVYVALRGDRTTAQERLQAQMLLDADVLDVCRAVEMDEELTPEAIQQFRLRVLRENPIMPSLVERDRPTPTLGTILTLGEAFQRERMLVILGDPGSGKTTLARWLTLKLARALRLTTTAGETPYVIVPEEQVDPEVGESDALVNLGPARLPVIVRVAEYAEAHAQSASRGEYLPLIDFLGWHRWNGRPPMVRRQALSPEKLNRLIETHLRDRRAVVALDGMDELTGRRDDIVQEIEIFIRDWIEDREGASPTKTSGEPGTHGGNQIIITSRIAGYHSAPVKGELAHFVIEPMRRPAVEHFCDVWTHAVESLLMSNESPEEIGRAAAMEAEGLKAAIFNDAYPRIRELAANPLLVTILALVYRKSRGKLPQQRAALYDIAIRTLVETWRETGLAIVEIIEVLAPVAAYIHERYSTGLIDQSELREVVTCHLAEYRRVPDPANPPASFQLDVDTFLRVVREEVGLLAARGERLYGFLHLTFQEYLAALELVRDRRNAAARLAERLGDPRWREPVLLALGHISVSDKWGPASFNAFLRTFLDAPDPLGDLIPRAALLVATALPEMAQVKLSPPLVRELARQLLISYAEREGLARFEHLRAQLEKALSRLREGKHREVVDEVLCEALVCPPDGRREVSAAVARLVREQGWLNAPVVHALQKAQANDGSRLSWAIDAALRTVVTPRLELDPQAEPKPPENPEPPLRRRLAQLRDALQELGSGTLERRLMAELEEAEASVRVDDDGASTDRALMALRERLEAVRGGKEEARLRREAEDAEAALEAARREYRSLRERYGLARARYLERKQKAEREERVELPARLLPFRRALHADPRLFERLRCDPAWLRVASALYGGYADFEAADTLKEYESIATFLKKPDGEREYHIAQDPEYFSRWGYDDVIYNMAVYLDTAQGGRWKYVNRPPEFSVEALYRDSALTPILLRALRNGSPLEALRAELWEVWKSDADVQTRADALVALVGLGEDVTLALEAAQANESDSHAARRALEELSRVVMSLADAVVRARESIIRVLAETTTTLAPDHWFDLVQAFSHTIITSVGMPLNTKPLRVALPEAYRPEIEADAWFLSLAPYGDDPVYRALALLDTFKEKQGSLVASTLLRAHRAPNIRWHSYATEAEWTVETLPCRTLDPNDIPLDAFAALEGMRLQDSLHPELGSRFRSVAVLTMASVVEANPALLPEILLFCLYNRANDAFAALAPPEVRHAQTRVEILLQMGRTLGDPYHRARTLLRALPFVSGRRAALLEEAGSAAGAIADIRKRTRVLERLVQHHPPERRAEVRGVLAAAARSIPDPDDRARALARITPLFPSEAQAVLLRDALRAVEEIPDHSARAETLQLLMPHLAVDPEVLREARATARALQDPWYRARALGLLGLHVSGELASWLPTGDPLIWTPLLLATSASEVIRYFDTSSSSDTNWLALVDPNAVRSFATLREQGIRDGLALTRTAALALETMLEKNDEHAFRTLLPLVRDPETSAVSFVDLLLEFPNDFVQDHALLLRAENARSVDIQTLPALIRLLRQTDDRSRFRAFLVLTGGVTNVKREKEFFLASELGFEVLEIAGQAILDFGAEDPGVARSVKLFLRDVLFDDPEMVRRWAEAIAKGGPGAAIAACVLREGMAFSPEAAHMLAKTLEVGDGLLLLTAFQVVCGLCLKHNQRNFSPELLDALRRAEHPILHETRLIRGSVGAVVSVARGVAQDDRGAGGGSLRAQEALGRYSVTLDELLRQERDELKEVMDTDVSDAVGYHYGRQYVFRTDADRAAVSVAREPQSFRLLVEWLADSLHEGVRNDGLFAVRTFLLVATAVSAAEAPASFANLARELELEPLLADAAHFHELVAGRVAAVELLGFLGRAGRETLAAMHSMLIDEQELQQVVIDSILRLRRIDHKLIGKLCEDLHHENAVVAYVSAQLLSTLGRSEQTQPQNRRFILEALAAAVRSPEAQRGVYRFSGTGEYEHDRRLRMMLESRLDHAFERALLEVSGMW